MKNILQTHLTGEIGELGFFMPSLIRHWLTADPGSVHPSALPTCCVWGTETASRGSGTALRYRDALDTGMVL